MKRQIFVAFLASAIAAFSAKATIVINFDTDAFGNPLKAPFLFPDTVRLTELYAPLGIHFSGIGGNDGGAILDQKADFGFDARSGPNFLAFNRLGFMADGGVPRDPETITFDTLASHVSIFAAAAISETFLMEGFDVAGNLIATDMITTQGWAELQITSLSGIKSVRISETVPLPNVFAFAFDDLSVDFVPEPSTISLLIGAGAVGSVLLRRRGRSDRRKVWRS